MADGRRCVDKKAINGDVIVILFLFSTVYLMHIVGVPLFMATDKWCCDGESLGEITEYSYSLSFVPSLSVNSISGIFVGFFVGLFTLLWLGLLMGLLDKYYPSCRELKNREKKRGAE